MKWTITLLFAVTLFSISCTKKSKDAEDLRQIISSSKVDTVIFAVDTLQYSFGSLVAKEDLLVIKQPSHAKLFELSTKQATAERNLHYAPKDGFLGIDSVVVLSKRISNDADPFIKVDSILIVIRTVKNATHKNLIGKWVLVRRCGGFTGGCDSINPANATEIEFGYNMGYTERYKGAVVRVLNYSLIDSVEIVPGFWRPRIPVYGVYSDIEFDFYFEYYGDELVKPGDLSEIYSRLKE